MIKKIIELSDKNKEKFILVGVDGTGKTTLAEKLARKLHTCTFKSDPGHIDTRREFLEFMDSRYFYVSDRMSIVCSSVYSHADPKKFYKTNFKILWNTTPDLLRIMFNECNIIFMTADDKLDQVYKRISKRGDKFYGVKEGSTIEETRRLMDLESIEEHYYLFFKTLQETNILGLNIDFELIHVNIYNNICEKLMYNKNTKER